MVDMVGNVESGEVVVKVRLWKWVNNCDSFMWQNYWAVKELQQLDALSLCHHGIQEFGLEKG